MAEIEPVIPWSRAAMEYAPRIVTRRSVLKGLLYNWERQYGGKDGKWSAVTTKLREINYDECRREEVDAIIGNDLWTSLHCGVCEMDRDVVVEIPKKYEAGTLICKECAAGVLSVFAKLERQS